MANKFLDDVGLKHLWDKITSTFAKKEDLNGIGGDSNTLALPCTLDVANMSVTGLGQNITTSEILDAINANKYIYLKVDALQFVGDPIWAMDIIAPLSQVIRVDKDVPSLRFSFILIVDNIPNFCDVMWFTSDSTAPVTLIPFVTQSQIGGLTFTTSSTEPTDVNSNVITFVDEG